MRQTILAVLSLSVATALLTGCGGDWVLVNPKGPVAAGLSNLMMISIYLMLLVVIPTIIMALWFGYKYRADKGSEYKPNWAHSTAIEYTVWGIPIIIIAILATLTWWGSHKYDPYRPLESDKKPVTIQVIAEQFKWVFIYPEQEIAMVNEVRFPEKTPVNFRITSNFTMNSFFIPQLAGQIYAMAGMQTQLNLEADGVGVYRGFSSNYSGYGFSQMYFKAHSLSDNDFAKWVETVKAGQGNTITVDEKGTTAVQKATLDKAEFKSLRDGNRSQLQIDAMVKNAEHGSETQKKLAAIAQAEGPYPTKPHPVTYYSSVDPTLFNSVINCYMSNMNNMTHGEVAQPEATKDTVCANIAHVQGE
ncbi:MAG: ubiquinol oxidase subunit II [Acinetobacter sp.]|nr:ubiquinol oxidase subunit II [Acinetobacter sp.]